MHHPRLHAGRAGGVGGALKLRPVGWCAVAPPLALLLRRLLLGCCPCCHRCWSACLPLAQVRVALHVVLLLLLLRLLGRLFL